MAGRVLWVFIFLYIGFIYATLPLARSILNRLYQMIGSDTLSFITNFLIIFIFALGIYGFRKKGLRNFFMFITPAIVMIIFAIQLERPEERIHFLEYGFLGFLVYKGFEKVNTLRPLVMGGFVIAVGAVDEIIQWFLPNRVGDLRDVAFNSLGGLLGLWFAKVYYSS